MPRAVAASMSKHFYRGVELYFARHKLPFPELPVAAQELESALWDVVWELLITKTGFMIRMVPSDDTAPEPAIE